MSTQEEIISDRTIKISSLFTTGLALFSMFFGAGNLIFPLLIGKSMGTHVSFGIIGLGITAVAVPFLGLVAIILFQANCQHFFSRIGKTPGMLLLLLLQAILGPFGVIPRLVTLIHAMAKPYLFEISLPFFSVLIACIIFTLSFKRHRLIGLLGSVLTPVLLLALGTLIFLGLTNGSPLTPSSISPKDCFLEGLIGGYNTMDLIAAFLFATLILPHFQKETEVADPVRRQKSIFKKMVYSSAIAVFLLLLTYVGLCLVSAKHANSLDPSYLPEQMLGAIAFKLLGPFGGAIAAVAVITACLTTIITLVSIFSDYLEKDLSKGKISARNSLLLTLLISTLFANLGFKGISAFLSPILQIVYPGLILLTLLNLLHALYGYKTVRIPVFTTFTFSAMLYLA